MSVYNPQSDFNLDREKRREIGMWTPKLRRLERIGDRRIREAPRDWDMLHSVDLIVDSAIDGSDLRVDCRVRDKAQTVDPHPNWIYDQSLTVPRDPGKSPQLPKWICKTGPDISAYGHAYEDSESILTGHILRVYWLRNLIEHGLIAPVDVEGCCSDTLTNTKAKTGDSRDNDFRVLYLKRLVGLIQYVDQDPHKLFAAMTASTAHCLGLDYRRIPDIFQDPIVNRKNES